MKFHRTIEQAIEFRLTDVFFYGSDSIKWSGETWVNGNCIKRAEAAHLATLALELSAALGSGDDALGLDGFRQLQEYLEKHGHAMVNRMKEHIDGID